MSIIKVKKHRNYWNCLINMILLNIYSVFVYLLTYIYVFLLKLVLVFLYLFILVVIKPFS